VRVTDITIDASDHGATLRADVHLDTHWVWGEEPFNLWFRYPPEYVDYLAVDNGDPFVAALLAVAMRLGEDLVIEAGVSPILHRNATSTIQDIWCRWHKDFQRVGLTCGIREPGLIAAPARTGLFFSLGVDSSYTLAKNRRDHPADVETIRHLLMVEGFDVYLWESERFIPMLEHASRVGDALGASVLGVTTNLRELTDRVVDWVTMYFAAALASTALAIRGAIGRVNLAASFTYEHLFPGGSHPLLDPLWGTEELTIVHDGCEASRVDKIRLLVDHGPPVLLDNLRVCNTGELTEAYNCGRCEKCIRTMIALESLGGLGRCGTLPNEIDLDAFAHFSVRPEYHAIAYKELLGILHGNRDEERLRTILEDKLRLCGPEAQAQIGLQVTPQ
jgi:hypothetical protein